MLPKDTDLLSPTAAQSPAFSHSVCVCLSECHCTQHGVNDNEPTINTSDALPLYETHTNTHMHHDSMFSRNPKISQSLQGVSIDMTQNSLKHACTHSHKPTHTHTHTNAHEPGSAMELPETLAQRRQRGSVLL